MKLCQKVLNGAYTSPLDLRDPSLLLQITSASLAEVTTLSSSLTLRGPWSEWPHREWSLPLCPSIYGIRRSCIFLVPTLGIQQSPLLEFPVDTWAPVTLSLSRYLQMSMTFIPSTPHSFNTRLTGFLCPPPVLVAQVFHLPCQWPCKLLAQGLVHFNSNLHQASTSVHPALPPSYQTLRSYCKWHLSPYQCTWSITPTLSYLELEHWLFYSFSPHLKTPQSLAIKASTV